MTTLSPCIVGTVETRKSTSLPRSASLMRPSCGSRRSAMLSFAMILTRETIAARQPAGRRLHLVQHAVDAVADAQLVLERLDVDVRRARLDGAADQLVDEADHRRLARHVLQPLGVLAAVARRRRRGYRRSR